MARGIQRSLLHVPVLEVVVPVEDLSMIDEPVLVSDLLDGFLAALRNVHRPVMRVVSAALVMILGRTHTPTRERVVLFYRVPTTDQLPPDDRDVITTLIKTAITTANTTTAAASTNCITVNRGNCTY